MKNFMKVTILATLALSALFPVMAFAGSQQTSSKTAAEIIDECRAILNESTEAYWSEAMLLTMVNDACTDIAATCQILEHTEDLTLATGTTAYTLTDNYITVKWAWYTDGTVIKGLRRVQPDDAGFEAKGLGTPTNYCEWNGTIMVFPKPGAEVDGYTITCGLVSQPDDVTSTDAIQVPAFLDNVVKFYVLACAFERVGHYSKAQWYWTLYDNRVNRYRVDTVERPTQPRKSLR